MFYIGSHVLPPNVAGLDLVKDLVFVVRTTESHRNTLANCLNPQRRALATKDKCREQDGQGKKGASPGKGIPAKEDNVGALRTSRAHEIHTPEGVWTPRTGCWPKPGYRPYPVKRRKWPGKPG